MMSYPQFGYPYPSVAGGLASAQLLTTATTTPTSISPATSCCEGGRPIMTDPTTGQTICSCQYPSATLLSAYPRVAGLADSVYSSAYAAHGLMPLGTDPSAFYSPLGAGSSTAAACYPYDPTMASYPYSNGYGGVDLQARRKNATRESTNTLKAWLYEHRKNPYPTKGEKIMLAIITKMTLTQVSTWFANARRRLKKENKMTWSPRNRTGDEDDDDDDRDDGDKSDNDDKDHEDGLAIDVESAADLDDMLSDDVVMPDKRHRSALSPAGSPLGSVSDITEHDTSKSRINNNESINSENRLSSDRETVSPSHTNEVKLNTKEPHEKPKIWSLAHVATSQTPPPARSKSPNHLPGPQFPIRPAHTGYLPSSLSAGMNGLRYTPYSLAGSTPTSLSHQFALASRASFAMSMGHPGAHTGHKLDTPPNTPPHSSGPSMMVTPMAIPAKPMALPPLHTGPISSVISPTDLSKSATLQSLRDNQHGTAFKPVAIR